MITIRSASWPHDVSVLSALDTSFTTERIYRATRENFSFALIEEAVFPPLGKTYPFHPEEPQERDAWDFAALAEDNGILAGFVAAQHTEWNRRVAIQHLYVMPEFRRQGIGTNLLAAVDAYARNQQARCVWLETQSVNYPAIRFYLHHGFQFCGFDESLYDPADSERDEVALFFTRSVSP